MGRPLLVGVVVAAALVAGQYEVPTGEAALPCGDGYHYAYQYTSYASGAAYYGWWGVEGRISVPTRLPFLNEIAGEHSTGSFNVRSSGGGWVQIGWMRGNGSTSIKYYYEKLNSPGVGYVFNWFNVPAATLGESKNHIVGRYGSGIWRVYYDYGGANQVTVQFSNMPFNSGMSQAFDEVFWNCAYVDSPPEMGHNEHGSTNPNTNAGLRLMNGNGLWEPWDTSLTAATTSWRDERNTLGYYYSLFARWYHFRVCTYLPGGAHNNCP